MSRSSARHALVRAHLLRPIQQWNLFADHPIWSPTLSSEEQIASTRLFAVLLIISLLIVFVYTSFSRRTNYVTLEEFSREKFEELEQYYPTTIRVPCTSVSIPYEQIFNISPLFHEVCSSSFVKQKWISSLFLLNATSHNVLDYRTFAFAQFRALRLLCRTARQAVNDARRALVTSHLTHNDAFPRAQFDELGRVLMNNLQLNLLANEKQMVNLVSLMIAQNRVLSALRTNYYLTSVPGSRDYTTINGFYQWINGTNSAAGEHTGCDCRLENNRCIYPAGAFYNWTLPELGQAAKSNPPPRFQIPGLMAGCTPMDSMRQSTLECLYNQSCVDALPVRSTNFRAVALNRSLTRFPLNITIGKLFDQFLFIESWRNASDFERYFQACQPKSLFYSYQSRFYLPWMIAMCISAYGGLVTAWLLVTPVLIQLWNRRKKKAAEAPTAVENAILEMAPPPLKKVVITHVHRTIRNFNLFRSDDSDNPEEEQNGIIATRLYIILLVVGLLILAVYTSIAERTQTRTIESPSLEQFEDLHWRYSSTLSCPCSRFSMSYARIMSVAPRYHPICSSEFLDDHWLAYFGRVERQFDQWTFLSLDFRVIGQSFFQLMRLFCRTSNETVNNARRVFRSTRLVSVHALSREQFHLESETRLKQFEQQTIASYLDLIDLIRSTIQKNHLVTEVWTSSGPISRFDNVTSKWSLRFRARNFYTNSCSCALSDFCTRPMGFYLQEDTIYSEPNQTVPGLVVGCFLIDSFLSSNLVCLYDDECLKMLIEFYDFNVVGLVRPLNDRAAQIKSLQPGSSRFPPNTTMESIVSQLFIEDWTNSTNFTAYFHRCEPKQCTYTIQRRFDFAYTIAMMLGFYGGLGALLEIILPPIVKLIRSRGKTRVPRRIHSINLFPSEDSEPEEQRMATIFYLFLFCVALIIAFLYVGPFSDETKTTVLPYPTSQIVNDLHAKNISSLSCPCSFAAINYSTFLSIDPQFHPICSSEFVQLSYAAELLDRAEPISIELSSSYRLLESFCHRTEQFLNNARASFASRELITQETMTRQTFDNRTDALVNNFIGQIPADFHRIHSFIIGTIGANQMLNRLTSNWKVSFTDEKEKFLIATSPRIFSSSNCSCATSSNCFERLTNDVVSGCLPYDGFRLSKLQNLSMARLKNDSFLIGWVNRTNYTAYFQTCRPYECRYTQPDRYNIIYMGTTILGLYGGLTYALRFLVDRILFIYRCRKMFRSNEQISPVRE